MTESLVDLLLVRLGREEEKRKVLKLLITSLDLSVTDAENAVENSPSVIREAVPMNEARIIQKDLYPYIDLLPRFDEEADAGSSSADEDLKSISRPVPDTDMDEMDDEDDYEADDYPEDDEFSEDDELPRKPAPPADSYDHGYGDEYSDTSEYEEDEDDEEEEEEEDHVLITSASDEIRSTTRCHICGRTPTDGEKLAPCRTCGDLTCRDCFDRLAHVCSKCAASGKSIDKANEGVEPEPDKGLVFDADEDKAAEKSGGSNLGRNLGIGFLVLVALAAGFYFIDPLEMFNGQIDEVVITSDEHSDTTDVASVDTVSVEMPPDTVQEVSENVDTLTARNGDDEFLDPFATRRLSLSEEYSAIQAPPMIDFRDRAPSSAGGIILRQESDLIAAQLSTIAAWIPVEIDDAALMAYHDTTSVLILVLRHPEETETRMALMRRVADWLQPSNIDQLVLIYKENRFQNTIVMSLVSEVFQDVQGVLNPSQFQSYLGYREDSWEYISGPVADWLTEI